jgi:hypothetical protein
MLSFLNQRPMYSKPVFEDFVIAIAQRHLGSIRVIPMSDHDERSWRGTRFLFRGCSPAHLNGLSLELFGNALHRFVNIVAAVKG